MALPIVHERAKTDVDEIAAWIAVDQFSATLRSYDAAEAAFNLPATFPGLGPEWEPRLVEFPGLRFWPIKGFRNYLVMYKTEGSTVEVLRALHGRRDVGRLFNQT